MRTWTVKGHLDLWILHLVKRIILCLTWKVEPVLKKDMGPTFIIMYWVLYYYVLGITIYGPRADYRIVRKRGTTVPLSASPSYGEMRGHLLNFTRLKV